MMIEKRAYSTDLAGHFDAETNREARVSAALGYLFFFVPLVMHPESKFARFHANQGLLLLLWMTLGVVLMGSVPYIGIFLLPLSVLLGLFFGIRGIILALCCRARRIPLAGRLVLIEYEDGYSLEV